MHVGEHHGRDIQVRIEGGAGRIGYRHVALGRHGRTRRRVGELPFCVVAFSETYYEGRKIN